MGKESKKAKQKWGVLYIAAGVIFAITSGWVLFSSTPERFTLVSDDGKMEAEGVSYNAKELYIASNTVQENFTTYSVLPKELARTAEMRIVHAGDEEQFFVLDEELEAWRKIENTWSGQGQISFAAGDTHNAVIPNYEGLLDEELKTAPEGSVGYRQYITYQIESGAPAFLLQESVREEFCGERTERTRTIEEQREYKEINTTVDERPALIRLALVTKWFINKNGSCTYFEEEE